MTGKLLNKNGKWVVEYNKGHEVIFYGLDPISEIWSKRESVMKFIHDGIEVDFCLITTGQFNEKKEQIVKEFHVKILYINHETI